MIRFARLCAALDADSGDPRAELVEYFRSAPPADAIWALYFFTGRKLPRSVTNPLLKQWVLQLTQIPEWLFAESVKPVGTVTETIALTLPMSDAVSDESLAQWVETRLLPLRSMADDERKAAVQASFQAIDPRLRLTWIKLLNGTYQSAVARSRVIQAFADAVSVSVWSVAAKFIGDWPPTAEFHAKLTSSQAALWEPFPFQSTQSLDDCSTLGSITDWQAEWKWPGLRVQVIRRGGEVIVWTRSGELITGIPRLSDLPDGTVLDGVLSQTKQLLVFDLLEAGGVDLRTMTLAKRRARLESLVAEQCNDHLAISPVITVSMWDELAKLRESCRARGVGGVILKRYSSAFPDDWWSWTLEPHRIHAVLMSAQPGPHSGRFAVFTFGVWSDGKLVPIAKADNGLNSGELREVDEFVRASATEKFGPVRGVKAELVFEISFETISPSTRHKAGVVVQSPRIVRWRRDLPATAADTLDIVQKLLES